jgi:uncharacterized integral membrane protein
MNSKTIFIIVVTILVTVILMKNTDEVNFWIFGNHSIPKLAVLGVMFGIGLILGYMAGRPRKSKQISVEDITPINYIEQQDKWIDPNDDYIN